MEHFRELGVRGLALGEVGAVGLPQRRYEGIAVLLADLAVLVAVRQALVRWWRRPR